MPEITYNTLYFIYLFKLCLAWSLASKLQLFILFYFLHFPFCANNDKKRKILKHYVVEQKLQSQQSCERKKLEKTLGSNPGINFLL